MSKRSSRPKEATPPPELSPQQRQERALAEIGQVCLRWRVKVIGVIKTYPGGQQMAVVEVWPEDPQAAPAPAAPERTA